ncbi:MAG: LysM peptidoglycan-binding domain-containing protein [Bacteroidota bacterium]|nr:LysM peptidoglycan-binding domain-containing protein [Bacteroidota bacterium]
MKIDTKQNVVIIIIGIVSILTAITVFNMFFDNPQELSKKQITELELTIKEQSEQLKKLEDQLALQKKTDEDISIINRLREKIKQDSIKLSKSKSNNNAYYQKQKKYNDKIINTVSNANDYIVKQNYEKSNHIIFIKDLSNLYSIRGLSHSQNESLRTAILRVNDIYIKNIIEQKSKLSKKDYVNKLYNLITKITNGYHVSYQINKLDKEIINNVAKTHTVKYGETLYSIAALYKVSQTEIKQNNFWKIKNDKIQINDELVINR